MEEQQAFFVYYSGHQEIHFNRRRPSFEILNSKSSLVLIQLTQDFLFFLCKTSNLKMGSNSRFISTGICTSDLAHLFSLVSIYEFIDHDFVTLFTRLQFAPTLALKSTLL